MNAKAKANSLLRAKAVMGTMPKGKKSVAAKAKAVKGAC